MTSNGPVTDQEHETLDMCACGHVRWRHLDGRHTSGACQGCVDEALWDKGRLRYRICGGFREPAA